MSDSERRQYELGERVTSKGEFFDDQDGGQNGHYTQVIVQEEITSTGKILKFIEKTTLEKHIPAEKIIATFKRQK